MQMLRNNSFPFESVHNFRGLGGIENSCGSHVRNNLLYRSGTLSSATDQDIRILSELGIKTVVDLRSHLSSENTPDRLPDSHPIQIIRLPIINNHIEHLVPKLQAIRDGRDKRSDKNDPMIDIYRSFPIDFTEELGVFINLMLNPDNFPLVCHCSTGKDRTGFFVSVILTLLGVTWQKVIEDYMKSNSLEQSIKDDFVNQHGLPVELARLVSEVRPACIAASFQAIDEKCGSFVHYLNREIGIDRKTIQALKTALLCDR